jgi:uncharacterized protein (DUF433 family)
MVNRRKQVTNQGGIAVTKLWKIIAIGVVLLAVLAVGAAVVLAQEPAEAPFVDEDGNGLCDYCGQMPDNQFRGSRRPGQRWPGMMDFRPGGFMRGGTIVETAADQLGMTVDEVIAERASGNSIAELALSHGVDVQAIIDAYLAEREAVLDASVQAGRITREQADGIVERTAEMALDHVNQAGTYGPGFRSGGGVHGMMGAGSSSMLEVLAQELDLDVDGIIAELQTGISIADVAANQGVEAQVIVAALLAEREAWLLEAVDAGRITQERSDLMMSQMEEMIEDHVNQPWGGAPDGAGYGCGRGFAPRSGRRHGLGSFNRFPGGHGRGMGTSGGWSGPMFQGQDT